MPNEQSIPFVIRVTNREAKKALSEFQKALNKTSGSVKNSFKNTGVRRFSKGLDSVSRQLQHTKNQLLGAFGGVQVIRAGKQVVALADQYKLLTSRLKLVLGPGQSVEKLMGALRNTADETRSPLAATVGLYTRMARSTKQLGLSQTELLAVTTAVNQSFLISGASTREAEAAIVQFGQALASGTLRGDELRSVLEQAPRLAEALAAGLGLAADGAKSAIGQIRALAEEGKLTTDVIVRALLSQQQTLAAEAGRIPKTVAGSITQLTNAFSMLVGQLDEASGISRALSSAFSIMAENIETVSYSLAGLAGAGGALFYLNKYLISATASMGGLTTKVKAARGAFGLLKLGIGLVVAYDLGVIIREWALQFEKLRPTIHKTSFFITRTIVFWKELFKGGLDHATREIGKVKAFYDKTLKGIGTANDTIYGRRKKQHQQK